MDKRVAARAGRQLRRSRIHAVKRARGHRAVALIAQRIDAWHIQQPGVLRTMRSMAAHAPFRLDRGVLIDKRSPRLHMALGADQVLIGSRFQVVLLESAMRVVAIAAVDRAFVHRVVEWHSERPLHVAVALVAQLRLRNLEQARFAGGLMHAVATGAAHVGFGMLRTLEVGVCPGVATQAGGIYAWPTPW
jgi:hypothetical protein